MIEPRTDCFDVEAGDLTLGMNNVITAFIAFSFGSVLTVIIFMAECIFRMIKNKSVNTSSNNQDVTASESSSYTHTHEESKETDSNFGDFMARRRGSLKNTLEP